MANILKDGEYTRDINSAVHGDRFQKDIALVIFLRMRLKPTSKLRLGYVVTEVRPLDDTLLIDDDNQVIHFIQSKHGKPSTGALDPIEFKALFGNAIERGKKNDFALVKYLEAYIKAKNKFKNDQYTTKCYLLSNRALGTTDKMLAKKNEQRDVHELLKFCGPQSLRVELTPKWNGTNNLIRKMNYNTKTEVKGALKNVFGTDKVSNKVVEAFFKDFSLLVDQPGDLRPLIDEELRQWLRTWVRPDILGGMTKDDMDRIFTYLDNLVEECFTPNDRRKVFLLEAKNVPECLEKIRNANGKLEAKDRTEREEIYMNRRMYQMGEEAPWLKAYEMDDIQFVEELHNRFQDQQYIVLVADPGMGKSRLLQFIAFEVQKKYDINVFLVYFNRLVAALNDIGDIRDFNDVISVLKTVISQENCEYIRNAPDQRTNSGYSILLVMDGFDEIYSYKNTTKVIDMLKIIQTKPSIQIVISSRMHNQELLENAFKVESMFLEPFRKKDQINYLKKWWNVPDDAENHFEKYAKKFMKQFHLTIGYNFSSYSSYDDNDDNDYNVPGMCGFPVMMSMLAFIGCDGFNQYLEALTTNHEQELGCLNDKLNVVQLYEQFIRKCFRLKCVEKSGGTFDNADLDQMIKGYIWEHQLLALKLIDIEIDENLFKKHASVKTLEKFMLRCFEGSEKSRLVITYGRNVDFAHWSYAEFLIAQYICENILQLKKDRFLNVLNEHEVIRKFSILMLDGRVHNHSSIADRLNFRTFVSGLSDFRFAQWACEGGCENIINILLENFETSSKSDPSNMLRISAKNGHKDICNLLLDRGADPNERDEKKWTALHMAAREGHIAVVELLLKRNAKVDALGAQDWTALHLAADRGHVQIIGTLIKEGANIDSKERYGETPLHKAVQRGHEQASKLLINKEADVNKEDNEKYTALHWAVKEGWYNTTGINLVRLLLSPQAEVNSQNNDGLAVIHTAAELGNAQAIELLLGAKANPNSCTKHGKKTPLHLAVEKGCKAVELMGYRPSLIDHVGVVKLLLHNHKCNVNSVDDQDKTALHYAAKEGNFEIAKILIETGGSLTGDDKLPLHFAAKNGCEEVPDRSICRNIDVNARDNLGRTALHWAAHANNFALVKLLLQHNAKKDIFDELGLTVLHIATDRRNVSMIQALISAGMSPDSRTKDGKTPLHIAADKEWFWKHLWHTNSDNGEPYLFRLERFEELEPEPYRKTNADISEHVEVVKLLLKNHADVNALDKDECTPLQIASEGKHDQIVQLLTTSGTNASESSAPSIVNKKKKKIKNKKKMTDQQKKEQRGKSRQIWMSSTF